MIPKGDHMYRSVIFAACVAMATMPLMAQKTVIRPPSAGPATETEFFPLQSGNKLKVSNSGGDIKISAWDKDEVALTANFKPSSSGKQVFIKIKDNEKSLKLTAKYSSKIWRRIKKGTKGASCTMELMVPHRVACNISSANGSITLNATGGQNKVETKNGAIALNGTAGNNRVKTTNGDISLNDINGSVDIFSPNGSIGGTLQNIEKLKVFTHTGSIRVKLLNFNCTIKASASSGDVALHPSGAKSFEYEKGKTIRATFGDGSASIDLKTLSGSIVID